MNLIEKCGEFLFWIVSSVIFNSFIILIALWVFINVLYLLVAK